MESRTAKFRAVGTNRREKIVEEIANHIESTWVEDIEFDREAVISVCGLSEIEPFSYFFRSFANICTENSDGPINLLSIFEGGRTLTY